MAWTMSATPPLRSYLSGRGAVRKAEDRTGRRPDRFLLSCKQTPWSLARLATIASLTHLTLLALSGLFKILVTPAQASVGDTFGSPLHLGLLVFSGTVASILMLGASRQSNRLSQHPRGGNNTEQLTANEPSLFRAGPETAPQIDQDWIELMARVSHELRTPLNAVIGFSDVMQRELLGPIEHDRYRDYITHIRDSGFALLKSTEDTLALTNLIGQTGAGAIDHIALAPLLRQAWQAVPHQAHNPIVELSCHVGDGITITANEAALRQAMTNLYTEAVSRAKPRTPIHLRLTQSPDSIQLHLSCQIAADHSETARAAHISSAAQDCPAAAHPAGGPHNQSGLSIVMARALLQLQGAELAIGHGSSNDWMATIEFPKTSDR